MEDIEMDEEIQERGEEGKLSHFQLWAMAIGSVIGGNFFGWQTCVAGGFGAALASLIPVAIMFLCLAFCICELVITNSHLSGGAYAYVWNAFGMELGFAVAVVEICRLFYVVGFIVLAICGFLLDEQSSSSSSPSPSPSPSPSFLFSSSFDLFDYPELDFYDAASSNPSPSSSPSLLFILLVPLIALLCFVIIGSLNIKGIVGSAHVQTGLTLTSVGLLVIYYISMLFSSELSFKDNAVPDGWITGSVETIFSVIPFTMWFFLGLEELPLAIEEAQKPRKNIPKAILSSLSVLFLLSLCTLFFGSSLPPGVAGLPETQSPIIDGFETLVKPSSPVIYVIQVGMAGALFAALNSFIFYSTQMTSSLAQRGILPIVLSRIHSRFGTAYLAVIALCISGYLICMVAFFACGRSTITSANILVFLVLVNSLFSYLCQCAAFLKLRYTLHRQRKTEGTPLLDSASNSSSPFLSVSLTTSSSAIDMFPEEMQPTKKVRQQKKPFLGDFGIPICLTAIVLCIFLYGVLLSSIFTDRLNLWAFLVQIGVCFGALIYYHVYVKKNALLKV